MELTAKKQRTGWPSILDVRLNKKSTHTAEVSLLEKNGYMVVTLSYIIYGCKISNNIAFRKNEIVMLVDAILKENSGVEIFSTGNNREVVLKHISSDSVQIKQQGQRDGTITIGSEDKKELVFAFNYFLKIMVDRKKVTPEKLEKIFFVVLFIKKYNDYVCPGCEEKQEEHTCEDVKIGPYLVSGKFNFALNQINISQEAAKFMKVANVFGFSFNPIWKEEYIPYIYEIVNNPENWQEEPAIDLIEYIYENV